MPSKSILYRKDFTEPVTEDFTEPVTVLEPRKFIGILIFTSVYHYPSVRSYWSNITKFDPIA